MVEVPVAMPVTTPVEEPMVAIVGVLLVHVPPVAVLLSVAVAPTAKDVLPVMPAGGAVTVAMLVVIQPVAAV